MSSFKHSFIGLVLLTSCSSSWEAEQLMRDSDGRNEFDSTLTNHFPELDQSKLVGFSSGYPAGAYALGMAYFALHQKNSENEINKLDKLIESSNEKNERLKKR